MLNKKPDDLRQRLDKGADFCRVSQHLLRRCWSARNGGDLTWSVQAKWHDI